MHIGYLIIGILCGAAGVLMLLMAISTSPIFKLRDKQLRRDSHDPRSQPERSDWYGPPL